MKTLPLRTRDKRLEFCEDYFTSVNAKMLYSSDWYREFELPMDVDKELTDRPFYWMWVEKTNQEVPPTTLRLAFDENVVPRENERLRVKALAEAEMKNLTDIERMYFRPPTAELVAFGSFRLDKILDSVAQRGAFACVAPAKRAIAVHYAPWLMLNACMTYRCDAVEQEWISVGIHLSTGQIIEQFYDMVCKVDMTSASPGELLGNSSLSLAEGIRRIRTWMEDKTKRKPTAWANEASLRLQKELKQIHLYYESILPDLPEAEHPLVRAEMQRKERELIERTQPRIEIEIHQIAVVALVDS